jgi:prolyl-tRNA synthetase
MYWSKYFIPTLKEIPIGTEAVSHQLLLRAGLAHMLTSGVYSYLPLGYQVLARVEKIICEEMNAVGAHQLLLPSLHPIDLWQQTGRDETLKEVMYRFKDKKGREMCLGPTHEEVITDLVKSFVQSYRQLPVTLYQIQTKFRDEMRTRFGIVRACEFIMKDAYSFDRDAAGLKKNYDLMYDAYQTIFKRCGLDVVIVQADSGAMGGDMSHEFLVAAPIGEDTIKDDKGNSQVAIELGHIFQLGTKYSQAQGALFLDVDGKQKPMIMGCYGIGVSRIIAAIIEKHHDDKGIIWPREVAPFDIEILPLAGAEGDQEIVSLANDYYQQLTQQGWRVLVDDREESPGRKFNDADLIGIPLRLTIGKRTLKEGNVELKQRDSQDVQLMNKNEVLEYLFNQHV